MSYVSLQNRGSIFTALLSVAIAFCRDTLISVSVEPELVREIGWIHWNYRSCSSCILVRWCARVGMVTKGSSLLWSWLRRCCDMLHS